MFLSVGCYLLATNITCFTDVAILYSYLDLEFRFWWPMIPFSLIATYAAVRQIGNVKPVFRELFFVLVLTCSVAGGEAAAWHVGPQAERWFAVAMALAMLSGAAAFIGVRKSGQSYVEELRRDGERDHKMP